MRLRALLFLALTVPGQSATAQTVPYPPVKLIAELAVDVDYVAPTLNGRRLYYVDYTPELWVYDVASKHSTKVAAGEMDEPSVSARGNRIAFKRTSEGGTQRDQEIWTIPLDSKTGLATGPARRASVGIGTDPSVSPDGKWIAFASRVGGYHLAVIPAEGGAERVLLNGIEHMEVISWSPDQRWLYFTVVLLGSPERTLQRVAVAGGKPELLAEPKPDKTARPGEAGVDGWVGLSADGAFLAVWALNGPLTLMDGSGKAHAEVPGADGWLSSSELLRWESHRLSPLKSISLADGRVRDVLPATYDIGTPAWAPDGRRFAVLSAGQGGIRRPGTNTLLIANSDGSNLRTITVPVPHQRRLVWSPDGRWIAMTIRNGTGITVVNVASGKTQPLRTAVDRHIANVRWTSDSKHVLFGYSTLDDNPKGPMIRRAGLDGSDAVVRALPGGGRVSGLSFLSDTSVLVSEDSGTYVRSLTSDRFVRAWSGRGGPSASPRGDLLAMSPPGWVQGDTAERTTRTADVVSSAGAYVANVRFPNTLPMGISGSLLFTPDSKNLVTWGWNPAAKGCCKLFVAPIDGGPVRTLAEFANQGIPGFALSPDGKTLLFTPSGTTFATIMWSVDVSSLLRGAPKP